jgi:hypothetical protein
MRNINCKPHWLAICCLSGIFYFFSIDSSEARKQYDEFSVNHANNNLCTWQSAFSRHRMDSSLWFRRMELIEVKSLIWAQKAKLYIIHKNVMWMLGVLRFKSIHLLFYTFIHMYISNDSNVIVKYFHFVLLVVSFKSPNFIQLMLSNWPPSSIVLAHRWSWVLVWILKCDIVHFQSKRHTFHVFHP